MHVLNNSVHKFLYWLLLAGLVAFILQTAIVLILILILVLILILILVLVLVLV
jgi:hypothetical protein